MLLDRETERGTDGDRQRERERERPSRRAGGSGKGRAGHAFQAVGIRVVVTLTPIRPEGVDARRVRVARVREGSRAEPRSLPEILKH